MQLQRHLNVLGNNLHSKRWAYLYFKEYFYKNQIIQFQFKNNFKVEFMEFILIS